MYYVYVLQSERDGKFYTGYTEDIVRRLWRHNQGYVASTRNRRPLKVVYTEPCESLVVARRREAQLKRGKSSAQKHRLIKSRCSA